MALLESLKVLNPSEATRCDLKTIATDNAELRFLRPDLRESSRQHTYKSFIAFSYCWDPSNVNFRTRSSSAMNRFIAWVGRSTGSGSKKVSSLFPVYAAIFNAILDECQSVDEGLSVDKLYIVQSDEAQTRITIAAIDVIYKCGQLVIVALEDVELNEAGEKALSSPSNRPTVADILLHKALKLSKRKSIL